MVVAAGILAVAFTLPACSSGPSRPKNDPRTDYLDPELSVSKRIEALDTAWEDAPAEPGGRDAMREAVESIAWSPQAPTELRLASIRTLLDETDRRALAEARELMRMRLWQERNPQVVKLISQEAAARGWTEYSGALVRSYARPWSAQPDDERPEREALLALHPGRSIGQVVLEVFLDPNEGKLMTIDMDARTRADAWDLLARLDPDGGLRMRVIDDPSITADSADGRRVLADLRAGIEDLGVVPLTGAELTWLTALRADDPDARAWWAEAAEAVAKLGPEQREDLRLRHIEPIRWSQEMRPAWLDSPRQALLSELRTRLEGRRIVRRTAGVKGRLPERLEDHAARMSWGQMLAILVVDVAIHDPGVVEAALDQIATDRADRTTEYGGLLHARPSEVSGVGVFRATLFPPRPNERPGDDQFVASADMIDQGVRTLAHYHFHAQLGSSAAVAGPSEGDLQYADRYGVNCLTLTSLEPGEIAVDYYCADGIVVDLGRIVVER